MAKTMIAAAVLFALLVNFSTAQENIKQNIDWTTVREAFEAYCKSPSADNANKILAALPDNSSYQEGDLKQLTCPLKSIRL
jgi:hypothetical protein